MNRNVILLNCNMSRMLKTCLMIATWIFVGILSATIGSTIMDLTEIAECGLEAIGQVLIGLNLAIPMGSIGAGILCDRYSYGMDLVMFIFLVSLSLSSAALPWCPSLGIMAMVMVIQGVSRGVITCCGNVMIVKVWKEKSSSPLYAMHFGTGFGSFIAPLLVEPFLSRHSNTVEKNSTGGVFPGYDDLFNPARADNSSELYLDLPGGRLISSSFERNTYQTDNKLVFPYGIMALFGLLCAASFLIFSFKYNTKDDPEVKENVIKPTENERKSSSSKVKMWTIAGSCTDGCASFVVHMAVILFFFYACVIGMVMSYPTYLLPIVVNGRLHLTKQQGICLTSGFWGSFAAGRLISAPLAKFVSVRTMLISELVASLITAGLLAFHSFTHFAYLWFYTCAFGFVSAPLFPSGIAWAEGYMNITGPLMATIQSAVGFGSFIASWLGGLGVERFGPNFPLLLNFAFSIGAAVLYVLMQIKASLHGEKNDKSFCLHKEVVVDEQSIPCIQRNDNVIFR